MPIRVLKIIDKPAPGERPAFIAGSADPEFKFWVGRGDITCVCGSCSKVLIDKMVEGHLGNIVLRCPKCGEYNEVP